MNNVLWASAVVASTGLFVAGGPVAAPVTDFSIAHMGIEQPTPYVVLVQGAEPADAFQDRMRRLGEHRSVLENAMRPRQSMPVQPGEPLTRPLHQSPEPMLPTVPQEPAASTDLASQELETAGEGEGQVSCEAAAAIVEDFGFSSIRPTDCSGELLSFSATRDGTSYTIKITAAAGEIADVSRQ